MEREKCLRLGKRCVVAGQLQTSHILGGLRGPSKRGAAEGMLGGWPFCGVMLRLPERTWRCSVEGMLVKKRREA